MSCSFLDQLQNRFPADSITRTDFREYLGISLSTDLRMFKRGAYPRLIRVGNHDRILLSDLSRWLEQGGSIDKPTPKRGRPVGSKNRTASVSRA